VVNSNISELSLESIKRSEGLVDGLGEFAGGLATSSLLQSIPVEGVIPDLTI